MSIPEIKDSRKAKNGSRHNRCKVLGITFFNGSIEDAISESLEGGLVLAPSGPGLSQLGTNKAYTTALLESDINIIDSGFMVLCWNVYGRQKLKRISGLRYIKALIHTPEFIESDSHLWVMPNQKTSDAIYEYLQTKKLKLNPSQIYNAPLYPETEIYDDALLKRIEKDRPRFIVINIAGGKQEILGAWLKRKLNYSPTIICTGAAIAFMCGMQTPIPNWVDRCYMGWIQRILSNPKLYTKRYWEAIGLHGLIRRFGANLPKDT